MKPIALILAAITVLTPSALNAGHCGQFFYRQHHVQHHALAVVQPLYFAGQATQDEAITRKAIRAELPAIVEAVRQSLQAPQQQVAGVIGQKCARCHQGENAKGGIDLTGELDDSIFRRSMEILAGQDVPDAMKGVVAGLKDGDHAAIMSEMLARRPKTGVLR